jgi:RNA polymerase sigma factor (sigma-70 family)
VRFLNRFPCLLVEIVSLRENTTERSVPSPRTFQEWFDRVRGGDPAAASEFVVSFAPVVRKVVRARLARLRLVHLVDPSDVCQTVMVGFFTRLTPTWPPVDSAERLTALLLAIARNKVRDEVRRHTAVRRDHRRVRQSRSADPLANLVSPVPSPGDTAAVHELHELALRLLTAEELALLEDRLSGADWEAIAARRGLPADVLRQKLSRAVGRVRRRLGQ